MAKKRGRKSKGHSSSASAAVPAVSPPAKEAENGQEDSLDMEPVDFEDKFEALIEFLYEKRAAARLHGLQGLVATLCSSVSLEDCLAREETLTRLLCSCVRKGRGSEPVLAARGLGLLMITLGLEEGGMRVWQGSCNALMNAAAAKEKPDVLRCAAMESYTIGCFVAEEDVFVNIEAMDKLRSLWSTVSHVVRGCAIRAWTVLLSSLSSEVVDDMFDEVVDELTVLLEDQATDVRMAAGDALALMYSYGMQLETEEMETSDGESSAASTSTGFSRMSGIEVAMDRIKDINGPKGQMKRKSKRDRAAMRTTFREICNFVADGTVEGTRIRLLKGGELVVNDRPGLIQLNFLRKVLAEGFHVHVHENELLHQIFQYSPPSEPQAKLTQAEKRMWKSPQSAANKLRTIERKNGYATKLELLGDVCF